MNGTYQLIAIDDLLRENRLSVAAEVYTMGFCTRFPTWAYVPDFHYCGSYARMLSVNVRELNHPSEILEPSHDDSATNP
jgi:hypothetical protein